VVVVDRISRSPTMSSCRQIVLSSRPGAATVRVRAAGYDEAVAASA